MDLYTAPTPNGWKASIMLEEIGAPPAVRRGREIPRPVDLEARETDVERAGRKILA